MTSEIVQSLRDSASSFARYSEWLDRVADGLEQHGTTLLAGRVRLEARSAWAYARSLDAHGADIALRSGVQVGEQVTRVELMRAPEIVPRNQLRTEILSLTAINHPLRSFDHLAEQCRDAREMDVARQLALLADANARSWAELGAQLDQHLETLARSSLEATDRLGQRRTFEVFFDTIQHSGLTLLAYRVKRHADEDWYEGHFLEIGYERVQSFTLNAHQLAGFGITEPLFDLVVAETGRQLVSSTNLGSKAHETEFRSDDATRAWERLVRKGRARRLDGEDRFVFVPRP